MVQLQFSEGFKYGIAKKEKPPEKAASLRSLLYHTQKFQGTTYRKNTTFVLVFMDKGIYNRLLFSSQFAGQDKTTFIENAVIMYAQHCDKLSIKTEEFLEEIKCPEEVPVEKTEERIKEEYEKVLGLLREVKVDNKYALAMFAVRNDLMKICPCLVESVQSSIGNR